MVAEILQYDRAESVVLIPGGLGEIADQERALADMLECIGVARQQKHSTPVFLGGNSLGVLSYPGNYDALFFLHTSTD